MSASSFCPNCYHPNPGEYCPQCGQYQAERRITVRKLIAEFLDDVLGVNARLPRTLKLLMFKPGRLTTDYFEGRIQQYISPFRLYLLSSILFFALFSMAQSSAVNIKRAAEEAREEIAQDSVKLRRIRATTGRGTHVGVRFDPTDTTNWLLNPEVNLLFPPLTQAAEKRLKEFGRYGEIEGTQRLIRAVFAQLPTVVFALLPLYAFLLWLFFRRQRRYYVEHFIFALHLHAFAFLAMLPGPFFDLPWWPRWFTSIGDVASTIIFMWVIIYIFMALRRVYGQGRLITGAKYFLLWCLYGLYLVAGIVISGVLAVTIG